MVFIVRAKVEDTTVENVKVPSGRTVEQSDRCAGFCAEVVITTSPVSTQCISRFSVPSPVPTLLSIGTKAGFENRLSM